jgi:hypothetical protein
LINKILKNPKTVEKKQAAKEAIHLKEKNQRCKSTVDKRSSIKMKKSFEKEKNQ